MSTQERNLNLLSQFMAYLEIWKLVLSFTHARLKIKYYFVPVCTSTGSSAGLRVQAVLPLSRVYAQSPPPVVWAAMDAVPTLKGIGKTPEKTGALWHWLILYGENLK